MKYLGLDWGLKKIGLAVSEGQLASPLKTLTVRNLDDAVAQIKQVVKEEQINTIILGQPGGESSKLVVKAYRKLQKMGLQVFLADETLSTQEAQEYLIRMGYSQKDRGEDNAVSAAIILQRYLDEKK